MSCGHMAGIAALGSNSLRCCAKTVSSRVCVQLSDLFRVPFVAIRHEDTSPRGHQILLSPDLEWQRGGGSALAGCMEWSHTRRKEQVQAVN